LHKQQRIVVCARLFLHKQQRVVVTTNKELLFAQLLAQTTTSPTLYTHLVLSTGIKENTCDDATISSIDMYNTDVGKKSAINL
jgi:hypothetical protein